MAYMSGWASGPILYLICTNGLLTALAAAAPAEKLIQGLAKNDSALNENQMNEMVMFIHYFSDG